MQTCSCGLWEGRPCDHHASCALPTADCVVSTLSLGASPWCLLLRPRLCGPDPCAVHAITMPLPCLQRAGCCPSPHLTGPSSASRLNASGIMTQPATVVCDGHYMPISTRTSEAGGPCCAEAAGEAVCHSCAHVIHDVCIQLCSSSQVYQGILALQRCQKVHTAGYHSGLQRLSGMLLHRHTWERELRDI